MESQLIYILGSGRSGTTLLDIFLGNENGHFSAGELNRYFEREGVPHGIENRPEISEFWKNIKKELQSEGVNLSQLKVISRKLEYHSAIINWFFISKSEKESYKRANELLFEAIKQKSGNKIIIDSSKYPMRLYSLIKVTNIPISVIYLKKNPFKVIKSFAKKEIEQPSKNWFAANIYLVIVHLMCSWVLTRIKSKANFCVIKFNDFIDDPNMIIANIEDELQINLRHIRSRINNNEPLQVGTLFDGNRIRLKDEIHIRKPDIQPPLRKSLKNKFVLTLHKFWWK